MPKFWLGNVLCTLPSQNFEVSQTGQQHPNQPREAFIQVKWQAEAAGDLEHGEAMDGAAQGARGVQGVSAGQAE